MISSCPNNRFGKLVEEELKPGGANIQVTDENKKEYITLLCEHRMVKGIAQQMKNFLDGFNSIIPFDLIRIFNHKELELLIAGTPELNSITKLFL